MARRWTSAEDRELARSYTDGLPLRAIAERLGRSEDALVARRDALGLAARRVSRDWSPRLDAFLCASAEAGLPAHVVAQRLDLPLETVRRRMRTLRPRRSAAHRYEPEEDDAIRACVASGASIQGLAVELRRSPEGIRLRARSLGLLTASTRRRWTDEEDRLIRTGYASGLTCEAIATQLPCPRSAACVSARARKLGLTTYARQWTNADTARLHELWHSDVSLEDIAERLGRTPDALRQRARKLGFASPARRSHRNGARPWTAAEDDLLRRKPTASLGRLARAFGRSDRAIRQRQAELGLRSGCHRSPHQAPPTHGELTPGEWALLEREFQQRSGRRLLALAGRLGRSPGDLRRLAIRATEGRIAS